jgi:type I restriction enzyme S subunit
MAAPLSVKGKKIIPTIWQERILKRDFDIVLGKMLQPEPRNTFDSEEFYLRSANIQWSGVDVTDIKTMWFSEQEKKFLLLRTGDLVVNEGGDVGRCAIWQGQVKECYYQNSVNRVRNQEKASTLFLYYWINNLKVAGFIDSIVAKTTIAHLTAEKLEAMPWPSIPLAEQIRIAAYLNASCAAIDAVVAAKKKQLEALIEMKKETLHRAFNHAEWPVERVKDLAIKIGSGVTPDGGSAGYLDEGIPLLRSQNVHFDGLRLDDVAFIAPETHREMRNSQLKPHDVLLNITGASIGRCTYVPDDFGEGNVNQHVCIIRPGHRLHYRFLAEYLSSPMGQGQIMSTFTGASRQGLSHKDLGLIRIPAPSIETQSEVVASLNTAEEQRSKLFSNIESQIATLIDYRKSLIHECVTGQRRISEADVAKVERTLEQAAGLLQQ